MTTANQQVPQFNFVTVGQKKYILTLPRNPKGVALFNILGDECLYLPPVEGTGVEPLVLPTKTNVSVVVAATINQKSTTWFINQLAYRRLIDQSTYNLLVSSSIHSTFNPLGHDYKKFYTYPQLYRESIGGGWHPWEIVMVPPTYGIEHYDANQLAEPLAGLNQATTQIATGYAQATAAQIELYEAYSYLEGKLNGVKMTKVNPLSSVSEVFKVNSLGGPLRHPDIADSDVLLGVEVEVENFKGESPKDWKSKEDHSLRNSGQEFTFGPATTGQIQQAVANLCAMAPRQGWHANVRTGIHIHVNVSNMSLTFVQRFVECYLAAERTLFKFAGEWRRWCNFCHPLEDTNEPLLMLKDIMNGQRGANELKNLGKYAGLNLVSLLQFGTVEVRILPTTFNYSQFCAWINAIVGIYEMAKILEEQNLSYIDYKKAYGLEDIINNIFNRNKISALEFADVIDPSDFKKAHRYIRWLSAQANNDIGDQRNFKIDEWFVGKEAGNKDTSRRDYLEKGGNPPGTYYYEELSKALQEEYLSDPDNTIYFLWGTAPNIDRDTLIKNFVSNHPSFGQAVVASLQILQ